VSRQSQAFFKSTVARKIRLAALAFALVFTLTALAQYLFLWTQINHRARSEFLGWATELKRELNYQGKWDLGKYRQAEWSAPGCVVCTPSGTILDLQGFVPGLVGNVMPPPGLESGRCATITNEIGELWRINCKQVLGALVLVGASDNQQPSSADPLLQESLKAFGSSLPEARKVAPRDVNRLVDFSVLDDSGTLLFGIGGIPLHIVAAAPQPEADYTQQITSGGKHYAIFHTPVTFQQQVVAWLSIPRDGTLEERTLKSSVWFNVFLAIGSWLTLGILTANYLIRAESVRRFHLLAVEEALQQEESDALELKSSLRWDFALQRVNKALEQAVVKTVVAFLNTSGGVLLVGVANDRTIRGLQPDYDSLVKKNWDGFQLHLQQILTQALGSDRYASQVSVEPHKVEHKDICVVRVKPALGPVVIKELNQPILYVRAGGASRPLNVEEALRYAQEHWGGYL